MSATAPRRKSAPFVVLQQTQHWRRINGRWYRDAVVLVDGQPRLYSLLDEVAA
jgi:hypothetical protein